MAIVNACARHRTHIIGQDRPFLNTETGELYIGAFMTHRSIELSTLVQHRYPILHDAVKNIGSVQIRNVATIGGNLPGIPLALANWVNSLQLSPYALIAALTVMYIVLGTALDGISMIVLIIAGGGAFKQVLLDCGAFRRLEVVVQVFRESVSPRVH